MSLFICKKMDASDVAGNVDEKLPHRAWPHVYQPLHGLMIFMKIVPSSVGSGVQNLMYSLLFLMIFKGSRVDLILGGVRLFREGGATGGL